MKSPAGGSHLQKGALRAKEEAHAGSKWQQSEVNCTIINKSREAGRKEDREPIWILQLLHDISYF